MILTNFEVLGSFMKVVNIIFHGRRSRESWDKLTRTGEIEGQTK